MRPSHDHPLQPPRSAETLHAFRTAMRLEPTGQPILDLRRTAAAFAKLPYENLTKIIKEHEVGRGPQARRTPREVIADHQRLGSGGTCFSLTAALLHLVRALGFPAAPILADRRYGANTHSALLVWIDEQPHLLDPGYLLVEPIALTGGTQRVQTAFNQVVLTPQSGGDKIELSTRQNGAETYRLTFKAAPADEGEFLRAWDASFDWDMMRYPLLTRTDGAQQLYLRGGRFQARRQDAVSREEIPPDALARRIAAEFGVSPQVAEQALEILHRKGERF
jgi:arylamine N-acetyltransferase